MKRLSSSRGYALDQPVVQNNYKNGLLWVIERPAVQVALQRRMFAEYEKRDRARKVGSCDELLGCAFSLRCCREAAQAKAACCGLLSLLDVTHHNAMIRLPFRQHTTHKVCSSHLPVILAEQPKDLFSVTSCPSDEHGMYLTQQGRLSNARQVCQQDLSLSSHRSISGVSP